MAISSSDAAPKIPREVIRKRPGMYIGDVGEQGLHILMEELIVNALSAARAAGELWVTLHADGGATVADDGPGFSVEPVKHEGEVVPFVRQALESFHLSGKNNGPEVVSASPHGIGVLVVNVLSATFHLETAIDGRGYAVGYRAGVLREAFRDVGPAIATGTTIRMVPDRTIFGDTRFDAGHVISICRRYAFIHPGIRIMVRCERSGMRVSMQFPGGIADLVRDMLPPGVREGARVMHVERAGVPCAGVYSAAVALAFSPGQKGTVRSFVNCIETPGGGSHVKGFLRAVRWALKRRGVSAAGTRKWIAGMVAVVHVRHPSPQWWGCTKSEVDTPGMERAVEKMLKATIAQWAEEQSWGAAGVSPCERVRPSLAVVGEVLATL